MKKHLRMVLHLLAHWMSVVMGHLSHSGLVMVIMTGQASERMMQAALSPSRRD